MRIDKLLWFLRLAKTRRAAQTLVSAGHIRINGKRIERSASTVKPGDVLVLPHANDVAILRIVALPTRRGPPAEALGCYQTLDETAANPIAATPSTTPEGTLTP